MAKKERDNAYNPLLKRYPDSDKINSVSEGAECLYTRLIAQSDDAGRYPADPTWVLARLFTARMEQGMKSKTIADRIEELERVGLIFTYEVGGRRFLQIVNVYKTARKDVKSKVLYPEPLPESVTDPLRIRNEFGTLDQTRPTLEQTNTRPTLYAADAAVGKAFKPPSVDEVRAYCAERTNGIDPEGFVDFYTAKDWKIGKNRMVDWKAAVRNWEKNDRNGSNRNGNRRNPTPYLPNAGVEFIGDASQ